MTRFEADLGKAGFGSASGFHPRDGRGYGLAATRASGDVLVARVHVGMPFLGVNQTLSRIERARVALNGPVEARPARVLSAS